MIDTYFLYCCRQSQGTEREEEKEGGSGEEMKRCCQESCREEGEEIDA